MRQGVFTPKLKLLWHAEKIIDWKQGKNIFPVLVEMDLTNKCQLNCNFCTFKYIDDTSSIKHSVALSAITDMFNCGVKAINFTGGGEPTLHPKFIDILSHARSYGLDIGLYTNGYTLSEKALEAIVRNCTWARFSIDAGTKQTFKKTKGVDGFEKTLENLKRLHHAKYYYGSPMTLGVGFVITPQNYKEIYTFASLFSGMELLDYIQYKPMIDNCFENNHIEARWWKKEVEPLLEKTMKDFPKAVINLYKFNDLKSNIERDYDVCYGHAFCPCIGATGDIWVCTHLRNIEGFSFGNLHNQSFETIWLSQNRKDVIEKINLSKCQKYCKNNEINKVLYRLKNPDKNGHYNFL